MQKPTISSRQENLTYALLWVLLLVAPLLTEWLSVHNGGDDVFEWLRILRAWVGLLPFFLVFVLHNWFLAPLLFYGRRRSYYFLGVALLVALFSLYQYTNRPPLPRGPRGPQSLERLGEPPSHHHHKSLGKDEPAGLQGPHNAAEHRRRGGPARLHPGRHRPPAFVGQHELVSVIVLILMLGMNLGVKFYFRQRGNEQQLRELERQNLEHRLAYLRYQVNPHFLMNTLNNIHALIDLDSESAQAAVVELSRLLRYALYDAERPSVSLQKEVDFVGNYIALMRIRLGEQVEVRFEVSSPTPAGCVPPLLFATFVENAFKHGVSYQQSSFVHISFELEAGRLIFSCINSRFPAKGMADDAAGGLGLRNVRQRLDLLFPASYHLDIREETDIYAVRLDIPLNQTA